LFARCQFVKQPAATLHQCRHTSLKQRFDKQLFAAKVVMEGGGRQAGFGVDRAQGNALQAMPAKELFRAVE
jgi:hypothetical protein